MPPNKDVIITRASTVSNLYENYARSRNELQRFPANINNANPLLYIMYGLQKTLLYYVLSERLCGQCKSPYEQLLTSGLIRGRIEIRVDSMKF